MNKKLIKTIRKLIKEELYYSTLNNKQKLIFLEDVLTNLNTIVSWERPIIEEAFKAYMVTTKEDLYNLAPLVMENLYNSVENKLKTLNIRDFHYYSTNDKNIYLADLI